MRKVQDNPKKSQIIKELLFSPALILAVISAIAYICAYLQEMGFCHSFGIPTDFIIINWPRFLSYTVKVLAAGIGGGALGTIAIDLQFAILRLHWFQSSRRAYIPQATVIIVPIGIYLIVTYDYIMLALAVIGLIYISPSPITTEHLHVTY